MLTIIGAILAIGLLIIVHEFGHYLVARWCRMRVDRFSLGFGPAILKWRRGETDFTLGPIPFGGFVQIHGMMIAEEVDQDDRRSYPNRPVWQRFATIFAGPATNYLFAIVLAFGLYAVAGLETGTSWYVVSGFAEGDRYAAAEKLEQGDKIIALDGEPAYLTLEGKVHTRLPRYVSESGGEPIQMTVLRDGQEETVEVTPHDSGKTTEEGEPIYRLGILLDVAKEREGVGLFTAGKNAAAYPIQQTMVTVGGLFAWASGDAEGEIRGPVGIGQMITKKLDLGWIKTIELLMLLNVMLGLFNLFPLPALDGGRLVFLGYEMATRRRPNPKVEAAVHMVGIMAILLLLVVVTYKDIARLF